MDTLLYGFSYRPPLHFNLVSFTAFVFKESVKKIWNYNGLEFEEKLDPPSARAIISNTKTKNKLIAKDYMEELTKQKYASILLNDAVYYGGNFLQRTGLTIFMVLHMTGILLLSIFVKNKKNLIYSAFELIEIAALLYYFKKNSINHVTTFNSFEKSSNFLAVILSKNNIKITKVCTPNPIKIHYQKVVSDEFILTSPYQWEEAEVLKKNWFVEKISLWPVYEFKAFKEKYYSLLEKDNSSNNIGFYSSGFAKRNAILDNPLDDNYLSSEIRLMELLREFIKKYPAYNLKVYLHPIEKTDGECYLECKDYYVRFFKEIKSNLLFAEKETPTWKDFDAVNVSVAVISTVNSERLYCGFKTLFTPLRFKTYALDGTRLETITVKDESRFETTLYTNLNYSRQQFFKENKLEDFVFYSLPN
ncbi:MAG: hypothetical protein K0S12_1486 [Bacteroidetes bacterium]|jgi:hypothetical protein|nr:hypothetical protein [Bacteroidota bacterium]